MSDSHLTLNETRECFAVLQQQLTKIKNDKKKSREEEMLILNLERYFISHLAFIFCAEMEVALKGMISFKIQNLKDLSNKPLLLSFLIKAVNHRWSGMGREQIVEKMKIMGYPKANNDFDEQLGGYDSIHRKRNVIAHRAPRNQDTALNMKSIEEGIEHGEYILQRFNEIVAKA